MNVAERLRLARNKRGLTQKQLGKDARLSNAYVGMVERALDPERSPDAAVIEAPGLDALQNLADVLSVPVEWLAFGTGPDPFEGDEPTPDTERASH